MEINQKRDAAVFARLNRHIHELHAALYPEIFKPYDFEASLAFFEEMMESENFLFLLAEEEGVPCGYVMAEFRERKENALMKPYRSLYVHHISVSGGRRGCGTLLMKEVIRLAAESGIRRIELDYWSGNEGARAFYHKLGFKNNREYVCKLI